MLLKHGAFKTEEEFDKITVNRNMKELNSYSKEFNKAEKYYKKCFRPTKTARNKAAQSSRSLQKGR